MSTVGNMNVNFSVDAANFQAGMQQIQSSFGATISQLKTSLDNLSAQMKQFGASAQSNLQQAANGMQNLGNAAGSASGGASQMGNSLQGASQHMHGLSFSSTGARRELLVLAHEMSQGNWSRFGGSLMVLGERCDAMSLIFSGTGAVIAAFAAVVGIAVAGMVKGAIESKEFRNAILLTGDAAGVTEGQVREMAKQIGESAHSTTGYAREIIDGLIKTGTIGADAIDAVALAATRYQKVTKEESASVVADFAKMRDGVYDWAVEHNKHYHFMDLAIAERIRNLEKQGRIEEAEKEVSRALFNHLGEEAPEKLGILTRALLGAKSAFLAFWQAAKDFGASDTAETKINNLTMSIRQLKGELQRAGVSESAWSKNPELAKLEAQLKDAQAEKPKAEQKARDAANTAKINQEGIEASETLRSMHAQTDRIDKLKEETDRYKNAIKKLQNAVDAEKDPVKKAELANQIDSPEKQEKMLKELEHRYRDRGVPKEKKAGSRTHDWDGELAEQKEALEKQNAANGTFYEFSAQQEREFWQGKLAQTKTGSAEAASINMKIASVDNRINREKYENAMASLRDQEDAAGNDYTKKLTMANQELALVRKGFAEESKEVAEAKKHIREIEKEHQAQTLRIKEEALKTAETKDQEEIENKRLIAQIELDNEQITQAQYLQKQIQFENQSYAIALKAARDKAALLADDPAKYAQEMTKIEQLEAKHNRTITQLRAKVAKEEGAKEHAVYKSMETSFAGAITGMLTRAQSFRQAMASIFKSVYGTFVEEMISKPLADMAAKAIRETAIYKMLFASKEAEDKASAASQLATQKTLGISGVMSNASIAAAAAMASVAAIPMVGWAMAPGVGAETYATALGFLASASGGYDIPAGVNPLTQLHQQEMVLPAKYANVIRDMASGQGQGSSTSDASVSGGDTHLHVHAVDSQSVERLFRDNGHLLAKELRRQSRNFSPTKA